MIYNATLQRIDLPSDATPGGDANLVNGTTIAIPCYRDKPNIRQRAEIQSLTLDATDVIYVSMIDLSAAAISIPPGGSRLLIQGQWESTPTAYLVRSSQVAIKISSIDHVMIYAKAA